MTNRLRELRASKAWSQGEQRGWGPIGVLSGFAERVGGAVSETIGIDDVEAAFGDLALGGFEAGGVTDGHIEGSAHYEGRAIDLFVRPRNQAALSTLGPSWHDNSSRRDS